MADKRKRKSSGLPRTAVVRLLNTQLPPSIRASDEAIDLLRACATGWSQMTVLHSDPNTTRTQQIPCCSCSWLNIRFKTHRILYPYTRCPWTLRTSHNIIHNDASAIGERGMWKNTKTNTQTKRKCKQKYNIIMQYCKTTRFLPEPQNLWVS